ncbi:MAG: IS1380 family transposase [Planctomycetales bacterium]|nr:IS1380 family transposase [Planctomycetales bacterium]
METQCSQQAFDFQPLGARQVTAGFDGGTITSDAGGLLLRELEAKTGLLADLAACFDDFRDGERTEHTVEELIKQRVFALALGYEDLNDHDQLRADPLLATLVGKRDVTGQERSDPRDRGKPLAGKSTLNRLELTPARANEKSRYHGQQAGRYFHGYYKNYCYLPLYIFCGEHLLLAKLRPSNIDAAAGAAKQVAWIVEQIRQRWPQVRIILRGDGGFCRDGLMDWCENHRVDYVFGLAKNKRLLKILGRELHLAEQEFAATGKPARQFKDFTYRTRQSWSRERRVVGKAEHLAKGSNPRFIVTSLSAERFAAKALYEDCYCARGEMENRIKEQQLCLFADRTSCQTMRANQLRLWLSSAAYVLLQAMRQKGLQSTVLEKARCDTIRLKLLKIGAIVRVSVRRVWFSLAQSCPYQQVFAQALENLRRWILLPAPA